MKSRKNGVVTSQALFGNSFIKYKKGMSSIIAVLMFVGITFLAVIAFQVYYNNYNSSLYVDAEEKDLNLFGIKEIEKGNLYLKNPENETLNVEKVKIGNVECDVSNSYSGEFFGIDISECLNNLGEPGGNEIVIYTDSGVLNKHELITREMISDAKSEVIATPTYRGFFLSTWDTTQAGPSNNDQIMLPLEASGTYDFIVYWGDGTNDTITSWNQAEVTHTYPSSGIYTVNITGTLSGFRFANTGDRDKIIDISQWGTLHLGNNGEYFDDCVNLDISATDALNLTGTTNLFEMFRHTLSLTNTNFSAWDTSGVTNMRNMFLAALNFNGNVGNWNTSSVTDMRDMFDLAGNFNGDISSWDVSSVQYLNGMFNSATSFNQDISSWNTSSSINMNSMFINSIVFDQDISSWDVDQVTTCTYFSTGTNSSWTTPEKPVFTSCTPDYS